MAQIMLVQKSSRNLLRPLISQVQCLRNFSTHFRPVKIPDSQKQHADVLIVGGGIAGTSLACALASSDYFSSNDTSKDKLKRIVVLDHTKLPNIKSYQQEGGEALKRIPEPRVITLSPNSLRFLKSIGVVQKCNQRFITEFMNMLVYEEMGNSYMKFGVKNRQQSALIQLQESLMKSLLFKSEHSQQVFEESQSHMGASIENNHLLAGLVERCNESQKVQIIQKKVVEIYPAKDEHSHLKPIVKLDDGSYIEADLLIGSDGEKSKVREEYGIHANGYSYNQNGLQQKTKRYGFPLSLNLSNNLAANRMALIGDAAHRLNRVHPLAGQGMNIGITGVAFLANSIIKAKKCGYDIGNYDYVLSDYEKQEKMMVSSIELVKSSYSGKIANSQNAGNIVGLFRNAAIDLIQSSDLLKYNFMNYASGNINHPINYEWQTRL